ncbi:hypothetical protein ACA910_008783 [Epithemia clementina (nom. ined.)]
MVGKGDSRNLVSMLKPKRLSLRRQQQQPSPALHETVAILSRGESFELIKLNPETMKPATAAAVAKATKSPFSSSPMSSSPSSSSSSSARSFFSLPSWEPILDRTQAARHIILETTTGDKFEKLRAMEAQRPLHVLPPLVQADDEGTVVTNAPDHLDNDNNQELYTQTNIHPDQNPTQSPPWWTTTAAALTEWAQDSHTCTPTTDTVQATAAAALALCRPLPFVVEAVVVESNDNTTDDANTSSADWATVDRTPLPSPRAVADVNEIDNDDWAPVKSALSLSLALPSSSSLDSQQRQQELLQQGRQRERQQQQQNPSSSALQHDENKDWAWSSPTVPLDYNNNSSGKSKKNSKHDKNKNGTQEVVAILSRDQTFELIKVQSHGNSKVRSISTRRKNHHQKYHSDQDREINKNKNNNEATQRARTFPAK